MKNVVISAEFKPAINKWVVFAVETGVKGTHEDYNVIYNSECEGYNFDTEEQAKAKARKEVEYYFAGKAVKIVCPECLGHWGKQIPNECPTCKGNGFILDRRSGIDDCLITPNELLKGMDEAAKRISRI